MKALVIVGICLLVSLAASCEEQPLRMNAERTRVSAGEAVVVHFDTPKGSLSGDDAWLTLARVGEGDSATPARVLLRSGAREATIATLEPGPFEVRLHASSLPGRPHRIVARTRIDVGERVLGLREPPRWFW